MLGDENTEEDMCERLLATLALTNAFDGITDSQRSLVLDIITGTESGSKVKTSLDEIDEDSDEEVVVASSENVQLPLLELTNCMISRDTPVGSAAVTYDNSVAVFSDNADENCRKTKIASNNNNHHEVSCPVPTLSVSGLIPLVHK